METRNNSDNLSLSPIIWKPIIKIVMPSQIDMGKNSSSPRKITIKVFYIKKAMSQKGKRNIIKIKCSTSKGNIDEEVYVKSTETYEKRKHLIME